MILPLSAEPLTLLRSIPFSFANALASGEAFILPPSSEVLLEVSCFAFVVSCLATGF